MSVLCLLGRLGDSVRKDRAGRAHSRQAYQWDRSERHILINILMADHFKSFSMFWQVVLLFFFKWCTLPMLNGSNPTETFRSIKLNQWCNVVVSIYLYGNNSCENTTLSTFSSILFPEMGVQTSPAFSKDKRVLVAGGSHCLCHQRGSSRRGIGHVSLL